jgi:hypothetical protein
MLIGNHIFEIFHAYYLVGNNCVYTNCLNCYHRLRIYTLYFIEYMNEKIFSKIKLGIRAGLDLNLLVT